MARSTYIYVVTEDAELVAAFTVKHELVTWLHRNRGRIFRVQRIQDGTNPSEPVDLPPLF